MPRIIDKTFKREILIGLIVLLVSVIFQIGGWFLSTTKDKKDKIANRQIELIDRFTLQSEEYKHLVEYQIRTFYSFNQFEFDKEFYEYERKQVKVNNEFVSQPSIEQKIIIEDSLRLYHPILYAKSIETDSKVVELLATLNQIELNFENYEIRSYSDSIKNSLNIDYVVVEFKSLKRNENYVDLITEDFELFQEKLNQFQNKLYLYYKEKFQKQSAKLNNLMIKEYKR